MSEALRSTATVIELGLVMTRVCLSRAGARRRVREGLTSRAHFSRRGVVCGDPAGGLARDPCARRLDPRSFLPKNDRSSAQSRSRATRAGSPAAALAMASVSTTEHDLKYEPCDAKNLGQGNVGTAKLMRLRSVASVLAIKYIERGDKIDDNVKRELVNHRLLDHPNIIRFVECLLTPTHLAIAHGVRRGWRAASASASSKGRFAEDEARFFFQQLIQFAGVLPPPRRRAPGLEAGKHPHRRLAHASAPRSALRVQRRTRSSTARAEEHGWGRPPHRAGCCRTRRRTARRRTCGRAA